MSRKRGKKRPRFSLRTRLSCLSIILILPFLVLTGYLLYSLNEIGENYNTIVRNVTQANEYNVVFKEDMDSVMYLMVAHSMSKYEVETELGMKNPDTMIAEAEATLEGVKDRTVSPEAKERMKSAIKLLTTLRRRVNDINGTVKVTGHYDENMERLDTDIRVITDMIQERISEYIYYESVSMENIRLNMDARRNFLFVFSMVTAVILLFISFLFSTAIMRSITKPIEELCRVAERVGRGDFEAHSRVRGSPEIDILSESIDGMAEEIGNLVERNRKEQIHLRETELKLIQAQINPHFLYNTLDNIVWLAEDDKKEEVETMVTSLSRFFRMTLAGGRDSVRIGEEVEHVRAYLKIQQFRYQDILAYRIDIPTEFENCQIIKMTLQPIVENALYHGIKNKRGGGRIDISMHEIKSGFNIIIEDTGIGMEEETLRRLIRIVDGEEHPDDDGQGFGLSNVAERLRLNYGESSGIIFHSRYGEGTKVEVRIPKIISG